MKGFLKIMSTVVIIDGLAQIVEALQKWGIIDKSAHITLLVKIIPAGAGMGLVFGLSLIVWTIAINLYMWKTEK